MYEVDEPMLDAACVRWIACFTAECGGVTLGDVALASEMLARLPDDDAV